LKNGVIDKVLISGQITVNLCNFINQVSFKVDNMTNVSKWVLNTDFVTQSDTTIVLNNSIKEYLNVDVPIVKYLVEPKDSFIPIIATVEWNQNSLMIKYQLKDQFTPLDFTTLSIYSSIEKGSLLNENENSIETILEWKVIEKSGFIQCKLKSKPFKTWIKFRIEDQLYSGLNFDCNFKKFIETGTFLFE
jgi:hypothetical protein